MILILPMDGSPPQLRTYVQKLSPHCRRGLQAGREPYLETTSVVTPQRPSVSRTWSDLWEIRWGMLEGG